MKKYCLLIALSFFTTSAFSQSDRLEKTKEVLNNTVMETARWAMEQEPETVTAHTCVRSEGGIHDFYSEGDYWWPDPENPSGAYVRRDGETNPENFVEHRLVMIRFSKIVGALTSAYILTGDESYVQQAFKHIDAWFVNPATRMNPNLQYAQAIRGVVSGRGIGIIDTIHLMEVAQGIIRMQNAECVDDENLRQAKAWFSDYINWLTTHEYGKDEMNAKNNHGTCWVMQVASFAKLTENWAIIDFCKLRYKNVLLPNQLADNGSFPLELNRTKPYGYSLFNLDAMTTICQILSDENDNLWNYTTEKGLTIQQGIDFMYPYVKDKTLWVYPQDVMYWDEWPVAQPFLIFGAIAYQRDDYFSLWESLKHESEVAEVERNLPIRNPLIWLF